MKNEIERFEVAAAMIETLRGEAIEANFTSEPDKAALKNLTAELNAALTRFYGRGPKGRTLSVIRTNLDNCCALLSEIDDKIMEEDVSVAELPIFDQIGTEVMAAIDRGCAALNALNGGTLFQGCLL